LETQVATVLQSAFALQAVISLEQLVVSQVVQSPASPVVPPSLLVVHWVLHEFIAQVSNAVTNALLLQLEAGV
jgi:hypothetical protein